MPPDDSNISRGPATPYPQRLEALVLDELRGAILAAIAAADARIMQRITTMEHTISSGFLAATEAQRATGEQIKIASERDETRSSALLEQGQASQRTLDGLLTLASASEAREARRETREAEDRARAIAREEEDRRINLARAEEDRSIEVTERKHLIESRQQVRAAVVKAVVGVIAALGALLLAWLAVRG